MDATTHDHHMMMRCIALSKEAGHGGEYPYAAIVCRDGVIIAEATNAVARAHDVTRHAEVVALSQAQEKLGVNLDDCEIYTNAEPCALCCYAIRETRVRRVIYALHSPHMGGVSRWNILGDTGLSDSMPEVFAPPPEIVSGFLAQEAEQALKEWNPLIAGVIARRGLFTAEPKRITPAPKAAGLRGIVFGFLRRHLFDRFGRSKV